MKNISIHLPFLLLLIPALTGFSQDKSKVDIFGYYKFDGDFTKLGDFPMLQPTGEVPLIGKLTKYKGKTRIAELKVRLSYEAGD